MEPDGVAADHDYSSPDEDAEMNFELEEDMDEYDELGDEAEDTELEDPSDNEAKRRVPTLLAGDGSRWVEHCSYVAGEPVHHDALPATTPHFQAADAIACCSGTDRDLVVTSFWDRIVLWGMQHQPSRPDDTFEWLADIRLGQVACYSLAISPDGQHIVIGGDAGLLAVLHLHTTSVNGESKTLLEPITAMCMGNISQGFLDADSMNNSVRFGIVGGKMRILVAGQDRFITLLECPLSSHGPVAALACHTALPEPRPGASEAKRQVLCMPLVTVAQSGGADVHVLEDEVEPLEITTTAIGEFSTPLNCAVASRCGRYLAAVGDAPEVHLLNAEKGYSLDEGAVLPFGSIAHHPVDDHERDPGAQYCAFNTDSSLLAVSSDAFRAVLVFDVARRQRVFCLNHHRRPCLALSWLPDEPTMLAWAEERNRCYVADLAFISHGIQKIDVEEALHSAAKITGLAVTSQCQLLVATRHKLLQWDLLTSWSPAAHLHFPPSFRAAVQTLLLASARRQQDLPTRDDNVLSGGSCLLSLLPKDVLLTICAQAAFPLPAWPPMHAQSAGAADQPPAASQPTAAVMHMQNAAQRHRQLMGQAGC